MTTAQPNWKTNAANKADEMALKAAKSKGVTSWLYLRAAKTFRWASKL